ncbi:hypothetical protein [Streptomyces sp. NPDC020965]|uniref:hypothetical protein n=1 Tax=Streptomyces sp. NPDC020965 TaxID=3365105 RepID=UPI0037A31E53
MPARPVGADKGEEKNREQAVAEAAPEDSVAAVSDGQTSEEDETAETAGRTANAGNTASTAADEESGDEPDDGPVFEVSDRRGSIVADATGVTYRLDEEKADFRWDEIGAVEIDTPRFGRRFSVTVYLSGQRWFQHDVEATSKDQLKTWAAELDAVLDARFEDGEAGEEAGAVKAGKDSGAGKGDAAGKE